MAEEKRRKDPRQEFEGPVQVRCASWSEFVELYTQNISHGGVFVRSGNLPEFGVIISVQIQMPNLQVLKLEGRVAHVIDEATAKEKGIASGFGVEFTNVTEEAVRAIAQLLQVAKKHQEAPPPPMPK